MTIRKWGEWLMAFGSNLHISNTVVVDAILQTEQNQRQKSTEWSIRHSYDNADLIG